MRLSGESIHYVLDLQKKKLPRVYCCSSIERLKDLSRGIIYYNGKVKSKLDESNDDSSLVNTLLIFLDEIKDENIMDIEKQLISMNKKEVVLLEAKEINTLIALQNKEENINFNYRGFAKRNNCVLIIEGEKYYITDGYNEFYIKNKNKYFTDEEFIDNVYTGMIASSIGICNNKSEIVQAILISTLSFYIAQKNSMGMIKKQLDNSNYENNIKLINEYLLEEISKIDAKKIKEYGDIEYYFKR